MEDLNIFFLYWQIIKADNEPNKRLHIYKTGCLDQRAEAKSSLNLQGTQST